MAQILASRMFFALFTLCFVTTLHAQNTLEGTVKTDSLSPNARCTIVIYDKDDKPWQSLACNEHGKYRAENVPSGQVRVEAKAIGHVSQSKKAFLFGTTLMQLDFELKSEAINLKGIEVKSSPILVNGDTTTYFVSRFSTGREKTLKEVVNNLPGVRYDEKENTLTVNGKRVSKVLVQGEDSIKAMCLRQWKTFQLQVWNILKLSTIIRSTMCSRVFKAATKPLLTFQ
ncbi:carboxypeptidase-like regulatory domain-containing protein [Hoylesella shahii]|uniref:carboxypeptidase-like regulatory domain-containing protein n=1 Tax=Hoylesella shahii TaxID=228603 RepID=UPI001E33E9F2|nr:carboxypeptidase-like regulatory domain-containing protein [Hoylesella shahii]